MPKGQRPPALRFRVRIPPDHPLYGALSELPPSDRPKALLELTRAASGAADAMRPADAPADIVRALSRIADALERMATGGRTDAAGDGRPALDALFGAFDDDATRGDE